MVVLVCSEDLGPMANALVEGLCGRLIGDEEGDGESVWCGGGSVIDKGESMYDGENVRLKVEVVLRGMNGNNKMGSF